MAKRESRPGPCISGSNFAPFAAARYNRKLMLTTLRFVARHPYNEGRVSRALLRYVRWQLSARLLGRSKRDYTFTEKTKLIVELGDSSATGNLYCGLYEYADMAFVLHLLRPSDLFADIGANIGAYSVLAAGEIGAECVAVEPIPVTFAKLRRNVTLNGLHSRVTTLNVGLGAQPGRLRFTHLLGTVNHVATGEERDTTEVEVRTLDTVVAARTPTLLKVDVEGFEAEVLRGGSRTLADDDLKAVIIELNSAGVRYGSRDVDIHETLLAGGFTACVYDPRSRTLAHRDTYGSTGNTLYVRDLPFARARVREARRVSIGPDGHTI